MSVSGSGTDRLRVGLAGLGTMGRNHLRKLLERDDISLVAVAEPAEFARRRGVELAGRGVRAFIDPLSMLAEESLDALVVAAPTTWHHQIAGAALDAGVAVLVEKPIAATVTEARDLVDIAAKRGAVLRVGHVERFNPAVIALAAQVHAGALGRLFSIRTIRCGPMPERIRDVGVAIDLATHDLDVICHLVGEDPIRVYAEVTRHAHTSHEDLLYGVLSFPGGVLGLVDVNWLTPDKQRRVTVLGENGMLEVDYLRQSLRFIHGDGGEPIFLQGYAPSIAGEERFLPVVAVEPLGLELDAFFSAVRDGHPSQVGGAEGLRALALANLLLDASILGRPLPGVVEVGG
jgi:UDP-N-acetylglucosamine 3-dehydrogenase